MSAPSRAAGRRGPASLPGDRESVGLLVSAAVSTLTLVVAFGLLALDVEAFWLAFVFGFGVALPAALGVVAHVWPEETRDAGSDGRTPMEELRLRYARGELSEAEFQRRATLLTEESQE